MAKALTIGITLLLSSCGQDPASPLDRPDVLAIENFQYRLNSGRVIPAEIGRLWIPSDNRATGVSLRFVRLRGTGTEPGIPVIYLAGGPGGSGIETGRGERYAYFDQLRRAGDVILLDQRGTGTSTPPVGCDRNFDLPTDRVLTRSDYASAMIAQAQTCAADLQSRGFDPADYNAATSADDIEQLRIALGAEKIILIGYSYGTHLALSYIRRYEGRVERAVLHGTEGPDHTLKLPSNTQRALAKLDTLVRLDPTYRTLLPNLLDSLQASLNALAARPESVMVGDTLVVFDDFEARVLIANELGNRDDLENLPMAIVAVLENGWELAAPGVLSLRRLDMLSGMSYAVDCASGATASRLAQIALEAPATILGDAINFPFPDICPAWDITDLGDAFRSPITSGVPVLFVAGDLDGRTPVSNAMEIAAGFSNGQVLIVENAGHNDLATELAVINPIINFVLSSGIVPASVTLPGVRFAVP